MLPDVSLNEDSTTSEDDIVDSKEEYSEIEEATELLTWEMLSFVDTACSLLLLSNDEAVSDTEEIVVRLTCVEVELTGLLLDGLVSMTLLDGIA